MGLGNIGWSGLILILVALLLIFGPSKLPDIGKAFGKSLKEFRSATKGMVDEVKADMDSTPNSTVASATTAEASAHVEPIELEPQKKSEQA